MIQKLKRSVSPVIQKIFIIDVNKIIKSNGRILFKMSLGDIPVRKIRPTVESVSRTKADTLFARKIATM